MSLDKFIQDGQDPKVVEKIYSKIEDMLTNGETITYFAIQKKPAVTLLPDCIVISNRRIFLCEFTKLGLSNNFEIFEWKDIKDIAFKEEIFGSKVTVIPSTGENLSIDYIPKTQARKLFQLIKDALEISKKDNLQSNNRNALPSEKEATKPIVRDLYGEAKEGIKPLAEIPKPYVLPNPEVVPIVEKLIIEPKVEIVTPAPQTATYSNPIPTPAPIIEADDEITTKLKKLKNLYDKQLITQAEYENKKADILEQL